MPNLTKFKKALFLLIFLTIFSFYFFEVDNVFVKNGSTNVEAERKKYRRQVKGGFNEKLVRYWEQLHGASPKPLDELSD